MQRVVFVLMVALALGLAPAAMASRAQSPPQPPRAPAAPPRDARAAKTDTAAIRGRVTSADGRPLRRAQIRATAPELREARTANTDTEGNYELGELPAGRYTLRVSRSGFVPLAYGQRYPGELNIPVRLGAGEAIGNVDFVLPRAGVIAGRILDEVGDPISGVSVYAMQLRYFMGKRRLVPIDMTGRTDDTGQYRVVGLTPGEYYVMASSRESWVAGKERTVMSFGPTYYPGAPSAATAQRVKVGLGQEVSAIDFALVVGRAAAIDGVALNASGGPIPGARISVSQEVRGPNSMSMSSVGSTTAGADGTFRLVNIPPGEYKLSSRGAEQSSPEGATQTIVMDGTDLENIVLVASLGGTVAGQIALESDGKFPIPLSRLRVALRSVDGVVVSQVPAASTNGAVDDEGRFELTGVLGTQRLTIGGVPDGWIVKSIERGGDDIADVDLTMRSGGRWDAVRVVLTDRVTMVTGTVSVDRDDQIGTGTVVLFRQEPALWGEASRHVRAVRPSQTGEFEARGLLPGSYFGVAVEYLPDGDWFDPEVLQSLVDRATRFTLGDAETRTLRLELVR